MRIYYSLLLFFGVLTGMLSSCNDDDKYIPTPPRVSIENLNGKNSCLPGETIELKVKLENPLGTAFYWSLDGKEVSKDSIYPFSSTETGIFKIVLTATNVDGVNTDTISIDVHNKTILSIKSLNGFQSVPQGGILPLKVHITTPVESKFWWSVNGEKVSTDSVYNFTRQETGMSDIVLNVSNADGEITETVSVEVYDKTEFRFASIANWTGQGENLSALAIQWVTGENLLEPADNEVFFRAWGYRWKNNEEPTGVDMLKSVTKNDPRLYLIIAEQWGGSTIKGFGYDGNNDGKIEIKNSSLHLTQNDFVDGIYLQSAETDIDGFKSVDADDYWIGGWYQTYASYWIGNGKLVPGTEEFEYSPTMVSGRYLENNSWDAWTFSPINPETMGNTLPVSRLLRAAEPNKSKE